MKDNYMKYAIVPLLDLKKLGLNSTDKLVMGMIVSLSIKRVCIATNKYLSQQLELSTRTISKSLSKLSNKNLISIKYEKDNRKIYSNIVWNDSSMDIKE